MNFKQLSKQISTAFLLSATLIGSLAAPLQAATPQHAISMYGDLKYPQGFQHFDYVNPDAPKGGTVSQDAIGTFDSFNPFIIKGAAADGIGLIYDSLLTRAQDEAFSLYGLLAESLEVADDRSWIIFNLNPKARFSDGQPVTAEDVIYSFKLLREQGSPFYQSYYREISAIEALSERRVKFSFSASENRELPLIVGEVSILPKHYWEQRDFSKPSLEVPVGSGPYVIDSFDAGRTIIYKRNPDYWGADLPVNRGRFNFDNIRYDYYKDGNVALEAFKGGEYDFRQETSSKQWATGYKGAVFDDGKIITRNIVHENPTGMQAFILNTRKPYFSDSRVRQALAYAFDFEWTNKNIFYNAYTRTHSFFSNSEMAATELPTAEELKILEPIRDQVPPEVFTQVYKAPSTKGDGKTRGQLRSALRLLKSAGWELKDGLLLGPNGKQMTFEILLVQPAFERIVAPFSRNLERMGIKPTVRVIDASQYINRVRNFDFDVIVSGFGQSSSPGNEQREYWHSSTADQPGSRNMIGIKNPAIDYLIDQLIQAPNRQQLVLRTRALDRVLQWNHYVIPQYHINSYRVAYWNKFDFPAIHPKYSLGFDTWWIKPDKVEQ
ncbi:extracellular solute-binding protein [Amphritea sp. 2_MG-2023]|uniref:extracellular solute-binding protein n=1 Tax=Amphritea TaxID=515417 RepID=UPI001C072FA0|nr:MULTISPECIES: extracellular solute-binding protein [Amphritea]MBU2966518.1 extracellular solute-binding protein [Amphritea atlantica]MDO6417623.1 extracellular solute-binding protein [Amphritea sp. 2_MG-2023]MDX2423580.1 extracellular solute-binding protein [Amphritea sp.]